MKNLKLLIINVKLTFNRIKFNVISKLLSLKHALKNALDKDDCPIRFIVRHPVHSMNALFMMCRAICSILVTSGIGVVVWSCMKDTQPILSAVGLVAFTIIGIILVVHDIIIWYVMLLIIEQEKEY